MCTLYAYHILHSKLGSWFLYFTYWSIPNNIWIAVDRLQKKYYKYLGIIIDDVADVSSFSSTKTYFVLTSFTLTVEFK